ncbi:hypothetical protein ACFQ7B_01650 [Streptomyces erythrochromogenes]|uniref:hypothetical protein n=1 Tax=Streptomyces erythrochromogenes TaxID=285574 RepID=UPI00368FD613
MIAQLPVSAAAAGAAAGGAAARGLRAAAARGVALVVTHACTAPASRSREPAAVGSHSSLAFTVAGRVWPGPAVGEDASGVLPVTVVLAARVVGVPAGAARPSAAAVPVPIPVAARLNMRRRRGSIRLLRDEGMSSFGGKWDIEGRARAETILLPGVARPAP